MKHFFAWALSKNLCKENVVSMNHGRCNGYLGSWMTRIFGTPTAGSVQAFRVAESLGKAVSAARRAPAFPKFGGQRKTDQVGHLAGKRLSSAMEWNALEIDTLMVPGAAAMGKWIHRQVDRQWYETRARGGPQAQNPGIDAGQSGRIATSG